MVNPSADRIPDQFDNDLWLDSSGATDATGAFELGGLVFDEFEEALFEFDAIEPDASGSDNGAPSLPIILLSAACGISAGIIGAYLARFILHLNPPASAAMGTLSMLGVLAAVGIALSQLVESRAATANIAMSCGLVFFTMLFFGFCTLSGAFVATFILTLGAYQ